MFKKLIVILIATTNVWFTFGCSNKNTRSTPPSSAQNQFSELKININNSTQIQADDLYRPGVVAYGLLESDRADGYYGLSQFTGATKSRGGYVKIDGLSSLLRSMSSTAELTQKLVEVDEAVSLAVAAGSKVELILACMLPNSLSKLEGFSHDVISGANNPSDQPIYSCSSIKNDLGARNIWFSIMEDTSQYFSKYGDNVVFIIGNEPETYFAGNASELFDLFELTANGLRSGNAMVKIGGLSPSHYKVNYLGHASPVYNSGSDSFSFSKENLSAPLLQLWLEFINARNIAIDIIQTKNFAGTPSPRSSGFWVDTYNSLESWLQANPKSYKNHVELVFSDYPGWHTVCAEDVAGQRESIWDSEYFSSWFLSTYISMKSFITTKDGIINNVEPLLGYLIEYGTSAFFHTSCEADKSKPAGFGGAMGLVTSKTKLPKPILHGLRFLTSLTGSLINVEQSDPNLYVTAAYDANGDKVTILLSHFTPSELNYNTAGYVGYDWGGVFKNNYGYTLNMDQLKQMPKNVELQNYLSDPNYPKQFIQDLMAGPEVLDLNTLGLPANFYDFFTAARTAGRLNRQIKDQYENGILKNINISFAGMKPGTYNISHQIIGKNNGNAYTQRHLIQSELEAAFANGGSEGVKTSLEDIRNQYGITSTFYSDKDVVFEDSPDMQIAVEPNSVHLITIDLK